MTASSLAFVDPRPDLASDHALWSRVFEEAPGPEAFDLSALLHCIRCEGAKLTEGESRLQIQRGDEDQETWRNYYLPRLTGRKLAIERVLTEALAPF